MALIAYAYAPGPIQVLTLGQYISTCIDHCIFYGITLQYMHASLHDGKFSDAAKVKAHAGFAQALLGKPRILFLDEPTNGLDPQAMRVDRLAILQHGELAALGSVSALRQTMALPLRMKLSLEREHLTHAKNVVAGFSGVQWLENSDGIQLHCPRFLKMDILHALHDLGDKLVDLEIQEAS